MRTLALVYYPLYAVLLHLLRKWKCGKLKKFLEKNENVKKIKLNKFLSLLFVSISGTKPTQMKWLLSK